MQWALIGVAFAVGLLLPLQNGLLTRIGKELGQPVMAAMAATVTTAVVMLLYYVATREPVPAGSAVARVPLWAWVGGTLGAVYLTVTILLAPKLGVAALMATVIAGQVVASEAIDHFGAFGLDVKPINFSRIAGAVLVIAGALLTQRT